MKELRNEREAAFCCDGDCLQGRICPRQPRRTEPPLTWGDAAIASFIVAAIVGFVFLGPMVRGVVHAWLS